ncbi:hypothetical protein C8R47DRAFT_1216594 [Mycena vitilis]|nr:hypothetical protein C8R47DRAFT_1216594 [Mycena vitilis]
MEGQPPFSGNGLNGNTWNNVRKMVLDGVHPTWAAHGVNSKMTTLALGNVSSEMHLSTAHFLSALQSLAQLEVMKLHDVQCMLTDNTLSITMPKMRSFSIGYLNHRGIHFLRWVKMPDIRMLQIEAMHDATLDSVTTTFGDGLHCASYVDISTERAQRKELSTFLAELHNATTVNLIRSGPHSLTSVRAHARSAARPLCRLQHLKVLDVIDADDARLLISELHQTAGFVMQTGLEEAATPFEYQEWTWDGEELNQSVCVDEDDTVLAALPDFVHF